MSRHRAAVWLLLLVTPVWAFGTYYSLKVRENVSRPRGAFAWLERYAKLRPHLEDVPRVIIVYDPADPTKGNKRLYQAQYVLAPVIVGLRGKRPVQIRPWKVPLLYDFRKQRRLKVVLAETAAMAEQQGVAMETQRVAPGLALVKLKQMEQE